MILIFVNDDHPQQARSRQRLVERLRRLGRDGDVGFATFAGVLDALVLDDKHLGRLVDVLLGALARESSRRVPHSGLSRSSVATRRGVVRDATAAQGSAGRAACLCEVGSIPSRRRAASVLRVPPGPVPETTTAGSDRSVRGPTPAQQSIEPLLQFGDGTGNPTAPPVSNSTIVASARLCRLGTLR